VALQSPCGNETAFPRRAFRDPRNDLTGLPWYRYLGTQNASMGTQRDPQNHSLVELKHHALKGLHFFGLIDS
jgi:hypothetical protein